MYWRIASIALLIVVVVVGGNALVAHVVELLEFELLPSNEDLVHKVIMLSTAAYAVLLAIPFVPGVEIGLAIITLLGPKIVPLVYLATVCGLMLSYLAGRLIPLSVLSRVLTELRLARVATLLAQMTNMSREERLRHLLEKAPTSVLPFLLRNRGLAIVVAINLPGNFVVGGGGGIALVAGISGLFSPVYFLLLVALAVAPVPIAILILGRSVIPG